MEGASKNNINLEAGLDISTSDMLVPFGQQTFQHNWQKYQGKFLPNSLRFEKNGWAAGWNVYNFNYSVFRKELADNLYAELGMLNNYVKMLSLYNSESSTKSLKDYYVIPDNTVLAGDITVNGNNITGRLNNKPYALTWDPVAHTVTCNTADFSVEYVINNDKSVTMTVSDDVSSFAMDFDLQLASALTGDAIEPVKYAEYANGKHIWNKYTYDTATRQVTTPEGDVAVATVDDGNRIKFDYSHTVTDETLDISYIFKKLYTRFNNITYKDQANETMLVGTGAAPDLAFNNYQATVMPDALVAEDEGGVIIDMTLPVWATCGFKVQRSDPNAKRCDNCRNFEVAVHVGTGIRTKVSYKSAFDNVEKDEDLVDNHRNSVTNSTYPQYIRNMNYRFNQILVGNTIEKGADWSPSKVTLITSDIWPLSTRQYASLRGKKTAQMAKYLGDVYTWGNFTFKAADYIEINNIWDWQNRDNVVYTAANISDILSVKRKGADNNTDVGDDYQFIQGLLPSPKDQLKRYIARFTGNVTEYTKDKEAKTIDKLYTDGKYIGGTYENVAISVQEDALWPFEKVPKFNYKAGDGKVTKGVYWTDGTVIITDLEEFKVKVLGEYDESISVNNSLVTENTKYSRKRVVKQYKATYDFKFIRESDYAKQEEYKTVSDNFNKQWKMYYPDIQSPLEAFDDNMVSDDNTYLNYEDIDIITGVAPYISYVQPGVYIFDNKAVPYGASSGLIIYDDAQKYDLTPFIYHHAVDALDRYTRHTFHEPGSIKSGNNTKELPFYFGDSQIDILVEGQQNVSRFTSIGVPCALKSASLTIGINYTYVLDTNPLSQTYLSYIWSRSIPAANNWLGNILLKFGKGTLSVVDATLNNNVEQIQRFYVVGSLNDGIKFGWPIKGHTVTRLTYPKMLTQDDINGENVFTFTKISTDDLNNKDMVFVDRDDVVKGQLLFNIVKSSATPDDTNGSGNICVKPEPIGDACLWYAKKQEEDVKFFYYLPGIVFGSVESTAGNMSKATEYPTLEIDWVPEVLSIPISATAKFSGKNTLMTAHSFYNNVSSLLNVTVTFGQLDLVEYSIPVYVDVGANRYELSYAVKDKVTGIDAAAGDTVFVDDNAETVTAVGVTGKESTAAISLDIDLKFNNNAGRFYNTTDNNYILTKAELDKVTVRKGAVDLVYSANEQKIITPTADIKVTDVSSTVQNIKAEGKVQTVATAMLRSVFDGSITGNNVTFKYTDKEYTFDMAEAENQSKNTGISVLSTDIRKADDTKVIGLLRQEGQYQLLRQQWNTTVEVENYWWIDAKHILELNQYTFILKRNTDELDDWNGNRFEKVGEISRDKVLPSNIIRYYVTNMYNSRRSALILTLQVELGKIVIKLIDPCEKFTEYAQIKAQVRMRDLNTDLNDINIENGTACFNTYNPLNSDQVLSKAEWTSTVVGDTLIIGCHLSNNIDQWAIAYDLTAKTILYTIQGYGYVGLHGELTGGQVPNDFFDETKGFNTKVQPLTTLIKAVNGRDVNNLDAAYEVGDISKVNSIETRVVGTSEQQWYIAKRVYGIVSHLTFDSTAKKFIKQLLPITNNYAAVYKSPSFASSVIGDMMVAVSPFASLFKLEGAANTIWHIMVGLVGYPFLAYLAPRYSSLAYLQQTFGQYAYVHYNSSKSMPEQEIGNSDTTSEIKDKIKDKDKYKQEVKQTDPVLSSAFTFDKQKFSQQASTLLDQFWGGMTAVLFSALAEELTFINNKLSLNEDQNQTATSDRGRKFLDNVIANVGDMAAASLMTQSRTNQGVTSTVTGLKSLDMFYSTCDQQKVFAGPGYVEHQFVADCVAQSVTDVQAEGKIQTMFFCIRALTTLQMQITSKLALYGADAADKFATATGNTTVMGTNLGPAGVALQGIASGLRIAAANIEMALVEINKLLDVICGKGITVNTEGIISKHALNVEGKHKYGEKNEVFMWPCWGVTPGQLKYTDEYVEAGIRNTPWRLQFMSRVYYTAKFTNGVNPVTSVIIPNYSSNQTDVNYMRDSVGWETRGNADDNSKAGDNFRSYFHMGSVPYYQASAFGKSEERTLPNDMAKVEGAVRFLPNEPFKNENIGQSEPVFAPSMIHDYIIDKSWDLSQCCSYGLQQWVTVKDTKITNCPPSNIVITDSFCGVACPYTAIEVKRGIQKAYMRPYAVTPNTLALNCTGYNTILDNKLYHSFDGISYRLVDLVGSPGMNKNFQSFWYAFQVNDRFKRSNIAPANLIQGNFESEPVQAAVTIDKMWTTLTTTVKEKGLEVGTTGEDKDAVRWAVPVFTEQVSTLPAAVKTMAASTLAVVDGVTSLVTAQITDTNSKYKAPLSVDFTIGKNVYRATEEYICSVTPVDASNIITEIIPSLGLKYIGATPTEAFFYSKATRCYYSFTGSALTKMDMMERFRDIQKGYWDFVNQEVVMPCLMTFKRLNEEVEDKDTETDNIIIPVLSKGQVSGELPPPITTIFNDRSWYKCVSLPCGFAYQGPNRVIINRSVFVEYMLDTMKSNLGKWSKMNREKYVTHRAYPEKYDNVMEEIRDGVDGWTHNPFVLVTSALGNSEDTDCLYEWNITFCWPIEMDLLYGVDNYACVNITAETMTPGGKVKSRPTHVFLTKELFTRNGNYGYYSFRFQSKNGAGNRERLHIWSDQYIAISSIDCESKVVTSRRTEQLTQQIDVQKLKEL